MREFSEETFLHLDPSMMQDELAPNCWLSFRLPLLSRWLYTRVMRVSNSTAAQATLELVMGKHAHKPHILSRCSAASALHVSQEAIAAALEERPLHGDLIEPFLDSRLKGNLVFDNVAHSVLRGAAGAPLLTARVPAAMASEASGEDSRQQPRIGVIIGSTRPTRIGAAVCAALVRSLPEPDQALLHTIDLAEFSLPLFDEPARPASVTERPEGYAHAHTRRWSRCVAACDAFVVISAEYNWGIPAALKNALDFLYGEWLGKPVAIVSYGARGGDKCAAALRLVLRGLKMRVVDAQPQFKFVGTQPDQVATEVALQRDALLTLQQALRELRTALAHIAQADAKQPPPTGARVASAVH
jgi:NAD(P)H-dependent FMN reductase